VKYQGKSCVDKMQEKFNELFNNFLWYPLIMWRVNNYLLKYTPFESNYNLGIVVKAQRNFWSFFKSIPPNILENHNYGAFVACKLCLHNM
jgi:hypothetical protein